MSREPVAWDIYWEGIRHMTVRAQSIADQYEDMERYRIVPLYAEPPEVGELARALVEKLDVVHEDPAYKGVWGLHYVHGGHYTGPTYTDELGALRRALAQYEDKGGTE